VYRRLSTIATLVLLFAFALRGASRTETAVPALELFDRTNLVAWCIVPFDAKKRTPEQRAEMLQRLGFRYLAYDYRPEHIQTFDAEILALKRRGIEMFAWWFPGELNAEARGILEILKRHRIRPQLWVSGGGEPVSGSSARALRIEAEAARIRPIAEAAAEIGCAVALYNHGGWFGEPENQVAIIRHLRPMGFTNVGVVYNLHHGHEHIDRFAAILETIKPHLLALNLNGMQRGGDRKGNKILPLGQGELDEYYLRTISKSGWHGPIGVLNHTDEDAEARLQDNLDGLEWLVQRLQGEATLPRPKPRSWRGPVISTAD